MKSLRVLYAGDSPVGGAANYLLGVLKSIGAKTVHLPPSEKISPRISRKSFDVTILSDYSRKQMSASVEKDLVNQHHDGMGLIMIGGWGSFSGPFGGWHGSHIEDILPVRCLNRDDRVNFPAGAALVVKDKHEMFKELSFSDSPVILGLNELHLKSTSRVLISVRKIIRVGLQLQLDPLEYPCFIIDSNPRKRVAALATDLAPHWCGGMVDWGKKHLHLPVAKGIKIEVGESYRCFIASFVQWLAG